MKKQNVLDNKEMICVSDTPRAVNCIMNYVAGNVIIYRQTDLRLFTNFSMIVKCFITGQIKALAPPYMVSLKNENQK